MSALNASDRVTESIRVQIESAYVPERSAPEEERYFFSYHVRIANEGTEPARLITRHWIIKAAFGRTEHVEGPGVVGEQPRLKPGDSFEYTSFCPLPTHSGSMRGTYRMARDDGSAFDVEIGEFKLFVSYILN